MRRVITVLPKEAREASAQSYHGFSLGRPGGLCAEYSLLLYPALYTLPTTPPYYTLPGTPCYHTLPGTPCRTVWRQCGRALGSKCRKSLGGRRRSDNSAQSVKKERSSKRRSDSALQQERIKIG